MLHATLLQIDFVANYSGTTSKMVAKETLIELYVSLISSDQQSSYLRGLSVST